MFGSPKEWPCPVIPLAVNVVHVSAADRPSLLHARQGHPQGGGILSGGSAGRDLRHRRHVAPDFSGPRAGLINSKFDKAFLDNLTKDPKKLTRMPHLEYMREAGAEGIEMVMWLIMRGALDDKVDEVYRFYTVPASNTAVGHIILEARGANQRAKPRSPPANEARRARAKSIALQTRTPARPARGRKFRRIRQRRGREVNEDLRRRPGRVRPEASRCAEAHSGRRSHLAGRRQSGLHRGRSPRNTASRITPAISPRASSAPMR